MADECEHKEFTTIEAAFAELVAVLEKHNLGGVLMVATQDYTSGWMAHFPAWSLVSVDGAGIRDLKPDECAHEAAERTMHLVGSLATMADDCLTGCAKLDQHLEDVFGEAGLIEVHDASDDKPTPTNAKPN